MIMHVENTENKQRVRDMGTLDIWVKEQQSGTEIAKNPNHQVFVNEHFKGQSHVRQPVSNQGSGHTPENQHTVIYPGPGDYSDTHQVYEPSHINDFSDQAIESNSKVLSHDAGKPWSEVPGTRAPDPRGSIAHVQDGHTRPQSNREASGDQQSRGVGTDGCPGKTFAQIYSEEMCVSLGEKFSDVQSGTHR